jgi:ribosome biogenesis GTPase A
VCCCFSSLFSGVFSARFRRTLSAHHKNATPPTPQPPTKNKQVPAWVTKRWLHALSREYPTLAFHASLTHAFGRGALLSLLRQLARLRSDKQAISVGFVGYPNVGKSSVINALRAKTVCKSAPVPGETKVWQYVALTKRVFLIDSPGVVYKRAADGDAAAVLKGVVRVEALEDATGHVGAVLARVKPEYLVSFFGGFFSCSFWSVAGAPRLVAVLLPLTRPHCTAAALMSQFDIIVVDRDIRGPPKRGGRWRSFRRGNLSEPRISGFFFRGFFARFFPRRSRKTRPRSPTPLNLINNQKNQQRRAYQLRSWTGTEDFLAQVARRAGKLLRGGDPDLNTAARMVLYDYQRGKLPFYSLPPGYEDGGEHLNAGLAALAPAPGAADKDAAAAPAFAAAVTEEEAAAEAGASAAAAAAGARAVRASAAAALKHQARASIPTRAGFFSPEEEALGGGGEDAEEESESEEGEEDGSGGGGDDGDEGKPAKQQDGGDADDDADDDEDSDGYGYGGLSWEAVMQSVQVS